MNKKILCVLILIFCFNFHVFGETVNDDIMDGLLNGINPQAPYINNQYNYESTERIPIKLKISEKISTKNDDLYDNRTLVFYTRQPVKYKSKTIFKQNTKFTANVATYMSRGMNGIPASIIVENFQTQGIANNKLNGVYIKKGLNLTPLVLPIKWALTPFPGIGSLTNFIIGGNAEITPNDTVTVYYYPDRN